MSEPLKIDDFDKLAPLVRGYELRPDCTYVVICDGKHFNFELAYALMRDLRESHPDVTICIVATLHPKSIEIASPKPSPADVEGS